MGHTPSDDEGLREDGIVRTWLREQGWLWHESRVITTDCMDDLEALISQKIIEARIGELKKIREYWGQSYDETLGGKFAFVSLYDIDKRIAILTANQATKDNEKEDK